MKTLPLIGAALFLITSSAFATECLTRESYPALIIATTSGAIGLSGNTLPEDASDTQLVCVRFNSNHAISAVEYINREDPTKVDLVPFDTLTTGPGYETTRHSDLLGKDIVVSRTSCPGCVANASSIKLVMGVLNTYRLIGKNTWAYPEVTVDLTSIATPRPTYEGTPFQIVTLRTESGLGGGVKQLRISQCTEADTSACLRSPSPQIRHLKTSTF